MKKRAAVPYRRPDSSKLVDAIQQLFTQKYKFRTRRNQVMSGRLASGGWIRGGTKGEADLTVYVPVSIRPTEGTIAAAVEAHRATRALGGGAFAILHVEVKHGTGRQSHEQKLWQQCVEANGEFYLVCRSQDDAEAFLREKGWA